MKTCTRCDRLLPVTEFGLDAPRLCGRINQCRVCVAEAKRQWKLANPEKVAAERRRYRTEHREQIAKSSAGWSAENCEKRAESIRRYCAANREKLAEKSRRYRAANPEVARHADHVRRAAMKGTDLTAADLKELLASRTFCPCCRKKMTVDSSPWQKNLDHIIPLGVGGTHTHANVRVICRTCNLSRPKDGSDLEGFQPSLWSVAA